jgi:hypothetical protein
MVLTYQKRGDRSITPSGQISRHLFSVYTGADEILCSGNRLFPSPHLKAQCVFEVVRA